MNSYPSKVMQSFLSLTHYTFNIWLGTDAMASKDTQRRLIKDNKQKQSSWPRNIIICIGHFRSDEGDLVETVLLTSRTFGTLGPEVE
jgi:hypothetical protein